MPILTVSRPFCKIPTPFFGDEATLKALKTLLRRRLLGTLSPSKPLRVWVPLCASGEDAYSVAICLLESLGSRWREIPLNIFCTDSDEDALAHARAGKYPARAVKGMARGKLKRFFTHDSGRFTVQPFVRSLCRFASHDLARTPHFSNLDLIVGREILAALPPPAREAALRFFNYALAPSGILMDHSGLAADAPELFAQPVRGGPFAARKVSGGALPPAARLDGRNAPAIDARLWESEERFRILFSKAEKAILVLDAETDRVLDANEAAQQLYGWNLPEFLRLHGKDLTVPAQSVRRHQAERRSEERLRLPHCRRKDGTVFPADVGRTFMMRQGHPCNLVIVRDATERLRKNSNRERDDNREAFVGDVVHELRSPISVIRGSIETLRHGVRGGKARTTFLKFIDHHTDRLARLVDQLLDLSAADSSSRDIKPSRVLLSEAVGNIAAGFVPVAKRRQIAIRLDIPRELTVMANPADLPHIVGNLLDNAIKFSPRRGQVFVSGRVKDGEGILSIRDTGRGIAPADLPRLFERFYRGERTRSTKGSGLGLSIVQGLVKANRGRIAAENDPSGGALFHVALPLTK